MWRPWLVTLLPSVVSTQEPETFPAGGLMGQTILLLTFHLDIATHLEDYKCEVYKLHSTILSTDAFSSTISVANFTELKVYQHI